MMEQTFKNWSIPLPKFSSMQIDSIKLVAFLAMIADHINAAFSMHNGWLMLFGRVAFPLFAVIWGINQARHNQINQPALNRLWLWAVIAQPGYGLVIMQTGASFYQLNILFTFAVAGQVLHWYQNGRTVGKVQSIALLMIYLPLSMYSYFIPGLVLLWLCVWLFRSRAVISPFIAVVFVCVVAALNIHTGPIFTVGGIVLSLFVLSIMQSVPGTKRYLSANFFLIGYVGHLTILGGFCLWPLVFNG